MPKLRRVNSGGPSNTESESILEAGILDSRRKKVDELLTDEDYDSSDDDNTIDDKYLSDHSITLEDIKKVDKVLEGIYGTPC